MTPRRATLALAAAIATTTPAAWLALPASAQAQAYPDHALRLVVGFPPGTAPDLVARILAPKLGEGLKQQLVIDNRAGAGGQIAAQAVAKSPADGYTLLLGEVGSIAIAPAAYSKLPYDPARELLGVSEVVRADLVLVVPYSTNSSTNPSTNSPTNAATNAATGPRTVAEFVTAARATGARGDKVNVATFGAGTPGHFGAEMFAEMAGFKIEPVHYRATGDAVTAIVAGDVQAAFLSTALAVAQVKGGKVRALATTAPQRSPLLPDMPTFTEAGYPKADFSAWFALFVPTGTPPAAVDLLNRQAMATLQNAEVRQKLQDAGFTVLGTSRADTERMLKAEATRWAAVVKATGFKAD